MVRSAATAGRIAPSPSAGSCGAQAAKGRQHLGIGGGDAGDPHDGGGGDVLGQRRQQAAGVLGDPLREVDDQRTELGRGSPPGRGGGRVEQVLLVRPSRRHPRPHGAVEAHDLAGSGAAAGQRVEGGGGAVPQLAVGGDQGGLGGGVLAHRREEAGVGGQLGPHRRGQHGGGHGAAAGGGERRCPQQLGQPVRGDEGDGGHAGARAGDRAQPAGGEEAPAGHADVVRRDDDGDRLEGLAPLGLRDGAVELDGRRFPVGRPPHVDPHDAEVRRCL